MDTVNNEINTVNNEINTFISGKGEREPLAWFHPCIQFPTPLITRCRPRCILNASSSGWGGGAGGASGHLLTLTKQPRSNIYACREELTVKADLLQSEFAQRRQQSRPEQALACSLPPSIHAFTSMQCGLLCTPSTFLKWQQQQQQQQRRDNDMGIIWAWGNAKTMFGGIAHVTHGKIQRKDLLYWGKILTASSKIGEQHITAEQEHNWMHLLHTQTISLSQTLLHQLSTPTSYLHRPAHKTNAHTWTVQKTKSTNRVSSSTPTLASTGPSGSASRENAQLHFYRLELKGGQQQSNSNLRLKMSMVKF